MDAGARATQETKPRTTMRQNERRDQKAFRLNKIQSRKIDTPYITGKKKARLFEAGQLNKVDRRKLKNSRKHVREKMVYHHLFKVSVLVRSSHCASSENKGILGRVKRVGKLIKFYLSIRKTNPKWIGMISMYCLMNSYGVLFVVL